MAAFTINAINATDTPSPTKTAKINIILERKKETIKFNDNKLQYIFEYIQ